MNIVWLGPVVSNEEVSKYFAVSPAANNWQHKFLTSLNRHDNIFLLTYLPQQYFPKGDFLSSRKRVVDSRHIGNTLSSSFINLPILRDITLIFSLLFNSMYIKNVDIIISYNSSFTHTIIGLFFQKFKAVKWFNIAADHGASNFSYGTIFLSYFFFKSSELKNKIFCDGGIDIPILHNTISENCTLNDSSRLNVKQLLFCGAINKWTGIIEFVELFLTLDPEILEKWELVIYGKGETDLLTKIVNGHASVKIFGFVSNNVLDEAMKSCFAFVNPRPENISHGEFNFPSKLLSYLSYLKPIISTRSPGISPVYEDVLHYYSSKIDLVNSLNVLYDLKKNELFRISNSILEFCNQNSWDRKIEKFRSELIDL